jgi:hypothetical protein
MSESMVERVAKAIDPVAFDPGYTGGPNGRAFRQDEARTKARAAIEAMREPNEDIRTAMNAAASNGTVNWDDYMFVYFYAALKE